MNAKKPLIIPLSRTTYPYLESISERITASDGYPFFHWLGLPEECIMPLAASMTVRMAGMSSGKAIRMVLVKSESHFHVWDAVDVEEIGADFKV